MQGRWKTALPLCSALVLAWACSRSGPPATAPTTTRPASITTTTVDSAAVEVCQNTQEVYDLGLVEGQIPHALIDNPTPADDARYTQVANQIQDAATAMESAAVHVQDSTVSAAARLLAQWDIGGDVLPPGSTIQEIRLATQVVFTKCNAIGHPIRVS
jgi:hypothetical protein